MTTKSEKGYEYDGKKLSVQRGILKLIAEGDWLRFYVKQSKIGWIQAFGVDSNGAPKFFDLVKSFIQASAEIAEEEKKKNKKPKK